MHSAILQQTTCVQLPHLHNHNNHTKFNAPSGRQEILFPFFYLCLCTWLTLKDKQSLTMLVDIYIYIHNTYAHTILQIIGAQFLLGLLATLVNFCTANFGMKSLASFAHPCYFQLRLTVLAGCLPCLGKPLEAQLSKDSEPSLSPACPTGVWWGLSQVIESKPSQPLSQREGQVRRTWASDAPCDEEWKLFCSPSGRRGVSREARMQKSPRQGLQVK